MKKKASEKEEPHLGVGKISSLAMQVSDHRKCVSVLLGFPLFLPATNKGGIADKEALFKK